ncbi:acetoacetate--CoA ligase [Conexibacter sp. SYSU D00693]|uniref:acetoacetate--CoA ligase n=1 Tax=Conexibacter sp. SYSU D00693 TaxID=2812560 RepID=UPI00196AB7E4|nr:acetoacetate--CoA ligase [Conexibacter sp. SYSU D00693]
MSATADVLWTPSPERIERAAVTQFARSRGLPEDYDALWRWSVDDLEGFWAAIWEHFGVDSTYEAVLASRAMPGAVWFPGAQVNYAEHLLRTAPHDDADVAIRHASELRPAAAMTWGELRTRVAEVRAGLQALGVGRGDRVAAYLPNIPDTIAAFLATASLGAIWSSAAPEFGARSVIDRFAQITPKVLLAVDGYRYGGKDFDRTEQVRQIAAEVGGEVVRFGHLDGTGWEDGFLRPRPLAFERVPFDHPLWVLYSSGTTGLPKPIVHGQGGILVEHLKKMHLHLDAQRGDRVFWFTTTGWMMWNFLVGVLLTEASIVLFDGNPGGDVLWDLAEETGITTFGTGAAYLAGCMKQGVEPARGRDLQVQAVGSTGSPLSPEGFRWVYDQLGADTWLFSTSGGTDVCTAFVGGVPTLPVYEGELQARSLGCDVQAWDEDGKALVGEVGELVIAQPMPSMPVSFWGDEDGSKLREAYFEHFAGVWRHGDWLELTDRGTAIIYGRSDSTINRGGVRMGTSELYRAVLAVEDVVDALVVDVPQEGRENWMPLFVVLREGAQLDDDLRRALAKRVREDCSPRHVPDEVFAVAEVPRTLSGKVLEVPVKRILMGQDPDKAASRDSLANPAALEPFVALARERAGGAAG